jgi:Skp family chaperone for outer membrane proteins
MKDATKKNITMEKTEVKTPGLGDISMIRDILMGQQINDYETRFAEVSGRINQLEQDLRNTIHLLDEKTEANLARLTQEMNDRMEKLRQHLDSQINILNNKIQDTSAKDRAKMAGLLVEISKKLVTE